MVNNNIKNIVLIILGTLSLILGIIGIFLPLLPTTPFLLLAAACYYRGSTKFYQWLISNKLLGEYIKNYQEGKGVPFKVKIFSLLFLWVTLLISMMVFFTSSFIQIGLLVIGIGVTIHIIKIKTFRK